MVGWVIGFVLFVVFAGAAEARAEEPSRVHLGLGVAAPGTGDFGAYSGLAEVGFQPWQGRAFRLRGQLSVGRWQNGDIGHGEEQQLRVGGETWVCVAPSACPFLSLESGMKRMTELATGPIYGVVLGGRVGLDFGGALWRGRVAADYSQTVTGDFVRSDFFDSLRDYGTFFALELELVRRF